MAPKLRRPVVAPLRVRPRRRAAAEPDIPGLVEKLYSWLELTLDSLGKLDVIVLDRLTYYNAHVKIAGRVRALHPTEGRMDFVLIGTQSERIMEAFWRRRGPNNHGVSMWRGLSVT